MTEVIFIYIILLLYDGGDFFLYTFNFYMNEVIYIYIHLLFYKYIHLLFSRWEGNIRMDLEEIGISAGNWVESPQDRNYWRALVNAALNERVS